MRRSPLSRWSPAAAVVVAALGLTLAWLTSGAAPAADSSAMRRAAARADSSAVRGAGTDPSLTTIVLVRHAEKDTGRAGADVPLNARGFARARDLVRVLGPIHFRHIYVTHWQRNRQTAEPLAARHGDSLTVIDDVGETVRALRAEPPGSTVLVVGHVYSIAPLIEGLTGRPFPINEPVSYDGLWIVTRSPAGGTSLVSLRYGAPDETGPEPAK